MDTYNKALAWLFSQTRAGAPRSLARMNILWKDLKIESPANCIYVVGTNGKGSVAKILASGLSHAGYKTGLFISPHVSDFCERISIDNQHIPQERVTQFVKDVKHKKLEPSPAFFEWSFALALQYFAEEAVNWAIIEAGVGAKLDATNTLENVRAVVITNVALDHQNSLGATLSEIAKDKAASIRKLVPTFTTASGEALEIIKIVAGSQKSSLNIISTSNLATHHIDLNKKLARATLEYLDLPNESIQAALNSPPLPARLERFNIQDREVILDGSHNPHAAEALLNSIKKPFTLVFGAHERKNAKALLEILESSSSNLILTRVNGEISSLETSHSIIPEPLDAFEKALELTPSGTIVIAGSFYLAGELRSELLKRQTTSFSRIPT